MALGDGEQVKGRVLLPLWHQDRRRFHKAGGRRTAPVERSTGGGDGLSCPPALELGGTLTIYKASGFKNLLNCPPRFTLSPANSGNLVITPTLGWLVAQ